MVGEVGVPGEVLGGDCVDRVADANAVSVEGGPRYAWPRKLGPVYSFLIRPADHIQPGVLGDIPGLERERFAVAMFLMITLAVLVPPITPVSEDTRPGTLSDRAVDQVVVSATE